MRYGSYSFPGLSFSGLDLVFKCWFQSVLTYFFRNYWLSVFDFLQGSAVKPGFWISFSINYILLFFSATKNQGFQTWVSKPRFQFPGSNTSWYRESPDSTNFVPPWNRTDAKIVLNRDWFSTKILIYDFWIFKVPFFCLFSRNFKANLVLKVWKFVFLFERSFFSQIW